MGFKFNRALFAFALAVVAIQDARSQAVREVQWTSFGLRHEEINRLALSPGWRQDGTAIAGSLFRGSIYRTYNDGTDWVFTRPFPPGVNFSDPNITDVVLAPGFSSTAPERTVVIGSIGGNGKAGGVSKDGGLSFATLPPSWDMGTDVFAFSPEFASDRTVFAASSAGIQRSTDGGVTFALLPNNRATAHVYSLAVSPNFSEDQTVFIGGTGPGLWKSIDGGTTLTPSGEGLPLSPTYNYPYIRNIDVSDGYAEDRTLFAAVERAGVFRSKDGGATWQLKLPWASNAVGHMAISPNFSEDHTIFAMASARLYVSWDAGESWVQLTTPPSYVNQLVPSPGFGSDRTLFAATGDGIWRTVVVPEPASGTVFGCVAIGWFCNSRRRKGLSHK